MIKRFLPIIIVALLSLLALKTLIATPFYTSHDGILHLARIAAYSGALSDGQFPPRWGTNLNGAMGSPIFVYIYPLPYLLAGVTHILGLSLVASYQFWMIVMTLISALAMYLWLKQTYGATASLVGAVAYVWVPYRFLNLYVRAAYAENLAFALPPFAFYCLDKVASAKNKKVWWAALACSLGGLLLMHTQVAAFTLPLLLGVACIKSFMAKSKQILFLVISSILVAFLISSFIYLPDFLERHMVNFDQGFSFSQEHFVAPWQFISSPWGYGFDMPGSQQDAMSFKIGQTQIAAALGALLLILYVHQSKKQRKAILTPLFFVFVWIAGVFLMTDAIVVRFIWERSPIIKTIVDYPWRLSFVVVFSSSVLLAFVVSKIKFPRVVGVLIIVFLIISNRNHLNVNLPLTVTDSEIKAYRGSGTAGSNEYKPRVHVNDSFVERKFPVESTAAGILITSAVQNARGIEFSVIATGSGMVQINRFLFPDTTLSRNGSSLTLGKDYSMIAPLESLNLDDTGLIEIWVNPPGGNYTLAFKETPLRQAGNLISLGTLAFVCGFLSYGIRDYLFTRRR